MNRPTGSVLPVSDPRRLVFTGGGLVGVVVVLLSLEQVAVVRELVVALDDVTYDWALRWDGGPLLTVSRVLSILGGAVVTTPLRIVVGVALALQRRWSYVAAWVTSILLMEVTVTLAKLGFDRQRPPAGLEPTSMAAFPSGHAAATAVTVTTLLLLLAPVTVTTWRRWWAAGAGVMAAMALSRVHLRVHWLSDVVMGTLVGVTAAVLAVALVAAVHARRGRDHRSREPRPG